MEATKTALFRIGNTRFHAWVLSLGSMLVSVIGFYGWVLWFQAILGVLRQASMHRGLWLYSMAEFCGWVLWLHAIVGFVTGFHGWILWLGFVLGSIVRFYDKLLCWVPWWHFMVVAVVVVLTLQLFLSFHFKIFIHGCILFLGSVDGLGLQNIYSFCSFAWEVSSSGEDAAKTFDSLKQ